ncbi:MAG: TolC family protein [Gammaproteobacteria bacterium]|nr:MAG: TolC family protein [Gammaproteobacteria bacterium]
MEGVTTRRRLLGGAVGLLAALLSACVHYTPRPRPPERIAVGFTQRTLSDPQLRALLERQLPARAWPRPQWDRADLLVAMLYFNDGLAAGRASARVATAGTRTAREHPNPTVTLMSEYANQHDGAPLWLWAVVTDWLLDAGARRGARIALADLAAQRAGYDLAELTWKQRGALRRAAADLLITEREIALRETVNTDRQAQLDMARRRLEVGAASRGDLDRLVRDALQDEQQLHDARRRASLARSALAVAVGVPVKVLAGLKLGWEQLDDPPAVDALQLERARDEALLARADVHGAVVAYGTAEQALRLEVARQYPDVHLGPAYTWDHGIRRYQFNLGLTLPLMNRNAGAIGEAEARREEAGARLEATVALAWQEIDEAIRQWQLARARLTEVRGPVYDAAQRIYAQTARGFDAGANDRTELVAARVAHTLAELQVLDAVRTAQEALATLEDALRRPLEGPELTLTATLAPPSVSNDGVTR